MASDDDYSKGELAKRRRELNKRVAKLAETLEQRRRVEAVVASAGRGSIRDLEEKYKALRDKQSGGVRP